MAALHQLDCELFLLVNRAGGPAWEWLVGVGTQLGNGLVLVALLAVGLRWRDPRRFPKNLLLIALAMAVAGLAGSGVKQLLPRARPLADPWIAAAPRAREVRVLPGGLEVRRFAVGNPKLAAIAPDVRLLGGPLRHRSFPSGHTAAAFGCAAGLVYAFRGRRRWLWLLPAGFVGLTRIACGVHFPSDVLAGALLGGASAAGFLRLFESFHGLASRPRPPRPRPPGEPLRVQLVAGETSADHYGARVLEALRAREPQLQCFGIGGEELERAGLERHGEASQLSIVGFTGVVARLATVVRLYRRMLALLRTRRPHVLVCIDLPDFNFMLALQARAAGVPVLFFISPQLWAWRSGRLAKLAERISKMVVIFPFEVPFYERAGVPVAFHGHPLLEERAPGAQDRDAARARLGLEPRRPVVVLAPGSRPSEWRHNAPALFGAAARLAADRPELQFAVPLAPGAPAETLARQAEAAGIEFVSTRGDLVELFRAADAGIVCSGTATLEAALAELPMVVFYRGNWLNALVARLLLEIDRIALPNIVLGGECPVFPERLQHRAGAEGLAAAARPLLEDPAERERLRRAGADVRARLQGGKTSEAVAQEIQALAAGDAATHAASG